MDARGLVIAGATIGITSAAACSASRTGATSPPPTTTTATPLASATGSAAPVASATATAPSLSPEQKLAVIVEAARRCEKPTATITNKPSEDGIVFNNAQTDPDAGYIDRLAKIVATVRETSAYRCCFDAWQAEHPDEELGVMLQLTLDPEGRVKEAGVDADRTSTDDELLLACLGAVARGSVFPPSPTGKDTLVDYPFAVAIRDVGPVSRKRWE